MCAQLSLEEQLCFAIAANRPLEAVVRAVEAELMTYGRGALVTPQMSPRTAIEWLHPIGPPCERYLARAFGTWTFLVGNSDAGLAAPLAIRLETCVLRLVWRPEQRQIFVFDTKGALMRSNQVYRDSHWVHYATGSPTMNEDPSWSTRRRKVDRLTPSDVVAFLRTLCGACDGDPWRIDGPGIVGIQEGQQR